MCVAAIGLVGGLVSAAASIYQGQAQSAAYQATAKGQEYQAHAQSVEGSYNSMLQEQRNQRLTGQQVTQFATSGVDIWGTPGQVIADSKSQGELDKQAVRYDAQYRSNLSGYESQISKMNAGIASTGGYVGAIAPMINSFTSLRTSFG